MSTAPSYVPYEFCADARGFGQKLKLQWHLPPDRTLGQLRAAIVQHHAAGRLRAALTNERTAQAAFARSVDESPQRLSNVLRGAVPMQIRDLGNAATLGGNALPVVDVLVTDVHQYGTAQPRQRRRPPAGPHVGFDPGPGVEYVLTVPRDRPRTLEEVTAHERALAAFRPILVETLQRQWPQLCAAHPMILRLDTVGSYVLGAQVHHGEDGIMVWACVDDDWDTAVRDAGYAMIDGTLILRIDERDHRGRPTHAVGLARALDLGEEILISTGLSVVWDGDRPQVLWDSYDFEGLTPVD